MMLRGIAFEILNGAPIEVNTCLNESAYKAVNEAESRLRHSDIVEVATSGRYLR
ncbi:hypothetical protein DPMN_067696 [Dreissena polymorpha]|uniref:Uncharacterized protein n=1 Tax=Dreissena polymorpha TaxID=45954 RepID=A0A9D3YYD5_DREPO|nr:hypothetical protein DPMN_067696 [Dreissena polymorpha]